jgi:hypothetical protein
MFFAHFTSPMGALQANNSYSDLRMHCEQIANGGFFNLFQDLDLFVGNGRRDEQNCNSVQNLDARAPSDRRATAKNT